MDGVVFKLQAVCAIPGDDWTEVVVEIDDIYRTADFRFGFLFGSDRGASAEGWFIDDVEIRIE